MSRQVLLLAAVLLGLSCCWLGPVGPAVASLEAKASDTLASLQTGVAGVLAFVFAAVMSLMVRFIPGLAVVLLGYTGYRLYAANALYNKRTLAGLAVAAGLTFGLIFLGARLRAAADGAGATGSLDASGNVVRSGELVLLRNGEVVTRADPRQGPEAAAGPGWQEALAAAIQTALVSGQEQVVLEFSRPGCTYCAKMLPVLQAVVRGRAAATGALAPGLAFAAPRNLALAPLRVFLLDAEEFPQLAQGFQVQAFPTLWVFGQPKVDPIVAKGFLEQAQLEEILQMEAMKKPPPEPKKGLARLFR
ncbi:unnamed protein product [Effrenium voratum]|uniref:Thioredoxin domain-containing protein n=1 Tax=Effrenium voratum TaxID=2562239 RepID=A0AA36J8V5_9DINO|nr:unnamed protein product [Effrenium voratum]